MITGVNSGDELANKRREGEKSSSKNDRNYASGDEFNGEDRFNITVGAIPADTFGVIDGNNPLGFIDFDQPIEHDEDGDTHGKNGPEDDWIDW